MKSQNFLITGAARGIARDLALLIASKKTNLILVDNCDEDLLLNVVAECEEKGANVFWIREDVSEFEELSAKLSPILTKFEYIDVAFAFAGISPRDKNQLVNRDRDELIKSNYYGVDNVFSLFFSSFNGLNHGPRLGKLVAITSISSLVSTQNSGYYSASKAALAAYLRGLRLKYRGTGFTVDEIICGFVDTRVNLNLKHARLVQIPSNRAATLILKSIKKRRRRTHSIPYFRNLPWFILRFLPANARDFLLDRIYKLIY